MPSLSIPIEYHKLAPWKQSEKGGVIEGRKMVFKTVHENVSIKVEVKGEHEAVNKLFSNWPLEVGGHIELKLNTKLAQKLIDEIAKKAREEAKKRKTLDDVVDDDIEQIVEEIDKT